MPARDAISIVLRGVGHLEKGEYKVAIDHFTQAINTNPSEAGAYRFRGEAYHRIGNLDLAIQDYNKAIELDSDNSSSTSTLAAKVLAADYSVRGGAYADKGDFDRAIKDFDKAIELNPNLDIAYNNRGLVYMRKENYEEAIDDFNRALQIEKRSGTYNNLGVAYLYRGDVDNAIRSFDDAIDLDPENALAYAHRGQAYADKGNRDAAITDLRSCIKLTTSTNRRNDCQSSLDKLKP